MRKTTKKSLILIILGIFIFLTPNVLAWDDCPFGYEDEPYPGTCWRYVDDNNDGICDLSQSEPIEEIQDVNTEGNGRSINQQGSLRVPYLLIISFLVVIILSIILKFLGKRKKISNSKEKVLFNLLLLIFFIPSAITGLLLLLMTNLKIIVEFGPIINQLHNISSLFFMWISGYHIIWHTKYYLKNVKDLLK